MAAKYSLASRCKILTARVAAPPQGVVPDTVPSANDQGIDVKPLVQRQESRTDDHVAGGSVAIQGDQAGEDGGAHADIDWIAFGHADDQSR